MVLDRFAGASAVAALVARKSYGKAAELIKQQLAARPNDPRLRMQLADVLILDGRGKLAIEVLLPLADEYAREGFAAKAIAVLKRIEKIEAGRGDVARRLAGVIKQGGASQPGTSTVAAAAFEIGIDELGIAPLSATASRAPEPTPTPAPLPPPLPDFDEFVIEEDELLAPGAGAAAPIVESALFTEFSQEELVDVIQGLQLLTFEPGDIIIAEGEPGSSLFVLTSGTAKAFVRSASGHQAPVRTLRDGDFFGEISILSGKPRTATITAASRCELLELDRTTLDAISRTKPRVRQVLKEFYERRAGSTEECRGRNE